MTGHQTCDTHVADGALAVLQAAGRRDGRPAAAVDGYERWCTGAKRAPWPVEAHTLLAWIASQEGISKGVLSGRISAVKDRHISNGGPDDPRLWQPARDFVRALVNTGRIPAPLPRSVALDRKALAGIETAAATGSLCRRVLTARNLAALHLHGEGVPVRAAARADPRQAVQDADGLVSLLVPARRASRSGGPRRAEERITLGRVASDAVSELLRLLPPDASGLLGVVRTGYRSPDEPDTAVRASHDPKAVALSVLDQLRDAADRAGAEWDPGLPQPATSQQALLVADHLDPWAVRRRQDRFVRTVRAQTGLRAAELLRLGHDDIEPTTVAGRPAWHLDVTILKKGQAPVLARVTVVENPDPLLCPVAALDALVAADTSGRQGLLLPSRAGSEHSASNAGRTLRRAARRADVATPGLGSRSLRATAATQVLADGGTVDEARELLLQERLKTTGLYLRGVEPWELDL